jgi:rod shape-determining protein MreD
MIFKNKLIYGVVIFFAIIMQKSFLPIIFGENYYFDFVLMLVLAWSVHDGFFEFLPWAIIAGCLYDFFFYFSIGLHAILFSAVVYLVSFFSKRFSSDLRSSGVFLVIFFIVVTTIASNFFDIIVVNESQNVLNNFQEKFLKNYAIFYEIIINGILFAICYLAIRKIKRFIYLFGLK